MISRMDGENKTNYYSSVTNALRILKSFSEENPEVTVKQLSETLGLSTSVTSRLLSALTKEGFVYKIKGTQKFRLGTSVLSIGGVLISSLEIHKEAMPHLERLVSLTGETSHLSFLENNHTVYLCKVDCGNPVPTKTHLGRNNPLHCTSTGKILMAYDHYDVFDTVITEGLVEYTPYTITNPETLKAQLKKIRMEGYAVDMEEHSLGVASVAAPIRDYTNRVIAAVNIVGPIQRVNSKTIPLLSKHVKSIAESISQEMGYFNKNHARNG
ncbi:IclR family transcriptional regulator [Niallia oryzisoli]|uniref:IclR family transcriptional regulator n=1 Tax=Niallia oryzisoli TaxID=1737571 RepID=UPI0037358B7C